MPEAQCFECLKSFSLRSELAEHVLGSHQKSFLFNIVQRNGRKGVTYYRQDDFTFHCECSKEGFKTMEMAKAHLQKLSTEDEKKKHIKYSRGKPAWLRWRRYQQTSSLKLPCAITSDAVLIFLCNLSTKCQVCIGMENQLIERVWAVILS